MTNKERREKYIETAIEEREHELVHLVYMMQYYQTKGARDGLGSDVAEAKIKDFLLREATIKDQIKFFKGIKI